MDDPSSVVESFKIHQSFLSSIWFYKWNFFHTFVRNTVWFVALLRIVIRSALSANRIPNN